MKERDDDSQRLSYGTPQLFSFEELKSFTSNLKKNVGFGGFGDVYKGKFSNGVKIAVKVLKENTKDVMIKQFMAEVSTMGSISHPNLIKLYGYCFDIDMKALVYEYMKFGSLDKILFKNHIDIEWEKLYNIAVAIADGLSFLHEECRPRIIHYDIKPDNVLIDSNYSPKIIDFGMARHSSQAEQSGYRGTNSYAAPEVGKGRLVTYKSDVYSFGMMMFEILRKKRNSVGPGWFPGEVAQKVENDELDEIILVCGIDEENKEKAEKLSLVALWCTQEKHSERPDMSSVVKMLKGDMTLEKPPNPFGFYDYSPESSVAGHRPLPKFSPAVIEGSRERAADLTKITSVHSGSSSTSRPPSKIIPNNDLKREIRPGQNAPLQKEQIKQYFSPQGNLIGGSTRIDGHGALSHFSPALTVVRSFGNEACSESDFRGDMADALSLIPASVLRNLADKLYEKRKNAALEQIVPPVLNSFSDQDSRVRYYACEALYNIAKTVRGDFIVFFNQIFDALCKLSADSDANVQSAAHLLDRLVKDIVTESDQFSIEEFIPLLRERMNVLNPYVRQFLVGWITVLDSVPDIDMLGFLPDFLDGLFNMLSDSSHEIRQQADSALSEFLQEIKNSPSVDYGRMAEILVQRAGSPDEFTRLTAITWINEFVKLGGDQLVPYYADILGAILPCISDKEEKIRVVARETNEELRAIRADPAEGFDVGAILSIARRQLSSEWEATRIEALHWIGTLLARYRAEVLSVLDDIFDTLLKALSDPSDEVVLLVLDVHACIARDAPQFRQLVVFLVHKFRVDHSLLEKRGALIIRRLCVLLDAERVYLELSTILEGEADLDFASIMVQALNLILLTSSELSDLRALLKQSMVNPAGKDLFVSLYASWCHSPTATISLCLLTQAYQHASSVIQSLVEEDINVKFLVQLDKLIRLLETPIFSYLRLQLLEPGRYIWLLKALYGLLMLLPQQSAAFKILQTRLRTVPPYSFSGEQFKRTSSADSYLPILNQMAGGSHITEGGENGRNTGNIDNVINFPLRLQQFEHMQHQHRMHTKSQLQARNSTSSTLSQEVWRPEELRRPSPGQDLSRPPSRSSWRGSS